MPVAVLHSRALSGFDAPPVTVEVHLAGGLPAFNLVGLPEAEVKESRDRVRAALQNALFEFPPWCTGDDAESTRRWPGVYPAAAKRSRGGAGARGSRVSGRHAAASVRTRC